MLACFAISLAVAAAPAVAQEVSSAAACARASGDVAAGRDADALAAAAACESAGPPAPALAADLAHVRGVVAHRRGLLVQAASHHEAALVHATASGDRERQRRAYDSLATISIDQRDYDRYFQYAQGAFAFNDRPTPRDRILYSIRRAQVYEELQDRDRADVLYREALGRAMEFGETALAGAVFNGLGLLYGRTGLDVKRAMQYYDAGLKRLAQARTADEQLQRAALLNNSASLLRDDPATAADAVARHHEALGLQRRFGAADEIASTLTNLGRALRMQGRAAEAESSLRQAVEAADAAAIPAARWQARLELGTVLADRDPAAAEGYYREAVDLVEGERGRSPSARSRDGALAARVAPDADPYDLLVGVLRRAGRDADAFEVAERARRRPVPDGAAGRREMPATPATIAHLQANVIAPDEAIVEFLVGARASTAWVVRRDRATAITLPGRAELRVPVELFRAAVMSPDGDAAAMGRPLAHSVWTPIAAHLAGIRLVTIVPDALLHYVPFEALHDEDGAPLIATLTIGYSPSSAALAFLRSRPPPPATGVIAIGEPAFPPAIDRNVKVLPFAGEELRAIARQVAGAQIVRGEEASGAHIVARDFSNAAVVHFATHTRIDERRPARSGLWLSRSADQDGLLRVREIYQLKLRQALVTLSAGETALGRVVTGEALNALTTAFFSAGADAVVAGLWTVNDGATAELMERFYGALAGGAPVDAALRSAKLELIRSGTRLSHPYYWAPFVAIGRVNQPALPAPTYWRRAAIIGVAVALALAAAVLLGRRARLR